MASFLSKEGLDYFYQKLNSKFSTIATAVDLSSKIELKADKTAVKEQIANLVNSAPETLDTLNELAAALGDDPNFATTIATEIGKKVNSSEYNDAIAGINTSIASITPEKIGALNKEEYLGPVVLEGNPIVYESGTEGLGIAAVSYLEPKQAGNGDPYPAGGGRNLLSEIGIVGDIFLKALVRLEAGKTYTLSVQKTPDALYFSNEGGTVDYAANTGSTSLTYTAETTGGYSVLARYGTGASVDFGMMLEEGATASEYQPYSNIRPITGYDKLNLGAVGKNLFNVNGEITDSNPIVRIENDKIVIDSLASGNFSYVSYGEAYKRGKYTFSAKLAGEKTTAVRIVTSAEHTGGQYNAVYGGWFSDISSGGRIVFETVADFGVTIVIVGDGGTAAEAYDITLAYGDADAAYAPYQGALHTIQIGQTVYGGKFDWLTGKLTKNVGNITLDGSQGVVSSWPGEHGNIIVAYSVPDALTIPPSIKSNLLISDKLKTEIGDDQHLFEQNTNSISMSGSSGCIAVCIRGITTLSDMNTWLSQNPVECVYPLANPVEIQLTPIQISELSGKNILHGDGSNIRAIFNTTGSASPVLESISGILPVEKGGTGSMSAAGARNNLGITPQNIGALPIGGGNVTGKIAINGGENYIDLSVIRKINGSEHTACLLPNSTTGSAQLVYVKDGTIKNHLTLNEYNTAFMQPVDIASGGTGANNRHGALTNLCALGTYYRGDMGDSPNFDDPGINGLFEVRSISETPNATGIRPFDGFGPLLSLKTPDNIAMLQLAAEVGMGLRFRTKQAGNVTLSGVNWKILLDDTNYTAYTVTKDGVGASGTWGISVTGNAATASAFSSARSIELIGAVYGTVSSNGASGWTINTTIAEKAITPTNFTSTFRTQTKGDAANGAFLSVIRNDAEDSWGYMPRYGTGIAFGRWDTHTYLYTHYTDPAAYIGGGAGDNLHWVRRIAFTDGLGAYGTWGISITGSSASCTGNAATATRASQDGNGANIASTYLKISGGGMSGRLTLNTSVTDHPDPMTQVLCINCDNVPSGTTLTDKNAPGIGFHIRNNSWGSLIFNGGTFKFINNDATGFMTVQAASFYGSGASLYSLNASNISSGTLAIARGGTGATSAVGARTNLGICGAITHGTGDPSGGSDGDIYFKHT